MKVKNTLRVLAASLLVGSAALTTSCGSKSDNTAGEVTTSATTTTAAPTTTTTTTNEGVLAGLIIPEDGKNISSDISLPAKYLTYDLTWTSSNPEVVSVEGFVKRPTTKTTVTLTATAGTDSKQFTVSVSPVTVDDIASAYTFKQDKTSLSTGEFALDTTTELKLKSNKVVYDTKTATITWALQGTPSTATITDGKLVVNATENTESVRIKATFSYGGETCVKLFTFSTKYEAPLSAEDLYKKIVDNAGDNNKYTLSGYVISAKEYQSGSIVVTIVDESYSGGFYFYRPVLGEGVTIDQLTEGTAITVDGFTTQNYGGLVESNSGTGTITLNTELPAYDAPRGVKFINEIIGTDNMVYAESAFSVLSAWTVKAVTKDSDGTGSQVNCLTVTKTINGKTYEMVVQTSKYFTVEGSDLTKEIVAAATKVEVGQIVNVKGLLGCYKNTYQMAIITKDAVTVVNDENSQKITAAVNALKDAKIPEIVTEEKTINTSAIAVEGAQIQFSVVEGSTVTVDEAGNLVCTPTADSVVNTIKCVITAGSYSLETTFTITTMTATDEQIVDLALGHVKMDDINYATGNASKNGKTVELLGHDETFTNVEFTYELAAGSNTCKIKNGYLIVNPAATDEEVTLTVTAKLGENTTKTKTVTFKVKAYATTDSLDLFVKGEYYYVTGVIKEVTNANYGNATLTLPSGEDITLYGTYDTDGTGYKDMTTKFAAGDTVVVYGLFDIFRETKEIANGSIVSMYKDQDFAAATTMVDTAAALFSANYTEAATVTLTEGVTAALKAETTSATTTVANGVVSIAAATETESVTLVLTATVNGKTATKEVTFVAKAPTSSSEQLTATFTPTAGELVVDTNNASLFGFDSTIFTVTYEKENKTSVSNVTADLFKLYSSDSIVIKVADGYVIDSVAATANGTYKLSNLQVSTTAASSITDPNGTDANATYAINSNEFTIHANAQVRFANIVITYHATTTSSN